MGRAGKNTHRQMLNTGRKDIQNKVPEHKTKPVTNVPMPKDKNPPLQQYANHPHCD